MAAPATPDPDQPSGSPRAGPSSRQRDFSLSSLGLGLAGVVAFILFILVRIGRLGAKPGSFIECGAHDCGPGTPLLFDWLPFVIALAAITGAWAGYYGRQGSKVRRVGFLLAGLNGFLTVVAFLIYLEWKVASIPD